MNYIPSKTALLLAAVLAAGLPAFAADSTNATPASTNQAAAKPLDLFANDIVAQGKGVKITRTQLDDALINLKASAAARGQQIPPAQMRMLEAQVLNRLIGMRLLNNQATADDKTTGAEAAQKRVDLIKENAGSEEALVRQLKTVGMTQDELVKKLTEEATAEAVMERTIKFEVTDADVKQFYDDNPTQFEQPEQVRAAHVLVGTKDKDGTDMTDDQKTAKRKVADDVDKRAKAGEDFAKLVKEYSDDPGSKDKGGEYTFPRGQMVPEFEAAAFALETNQVSDVVTTQFGYHIIKLLEKTPARKISFAEAGPDIKKYLKNRGMQKQIPDYMEKMEQAADVKILDEDLKLPVKKPAAPAEETATAPAETEKK